MRFFRHKETGELVKLVRHNPNFYLVYEYIDWQRKWIGAYFVSEVSFPDWLTKFNEINIKEIIKP